MHHISEFFHTLRDDEYAGKRVRYFDDKNPEDSRHLGLKGCNLCMLTSLKLPVPPGFILSARVCQDYYNDSIEGTPLAIEQSKYVHITKCCMTGIEEIELKTNKRFGAAIDSPCLPLVLSVRPSPPLIMSGLIGSVLNLGLNEDILDRLKDMPGASEHFVLHTYSKFLRDFGTVVMGADRILYDAVRDGLKANERVAHTRQLSMRALRILVDTYQSIASPPSDPYEQLQMAIEAIYLSYYSEKCMKYRAAHDIPESSHIAVVIQEMKFGNLNSRSGTGICYSHHAEFANDMTGGFLLEEEGDVQSSSSKEKDIEDIVVLKDNFPPSYDSLHAAFRKVSERTERSLQYLEFTIENDRCFILQTDAVKARPPSKQARFMHRMSNSFAADDREQHVLPQHHLSRHK